MGSNIMSTKQHQRSTLWAALLVAFGSLVMAGFFCVKWLATETNVAIKAGHIYAIVDAEEYVRESDEPDQMARELKALLNDYPKRGDSPLDVTMDRVRWNSVSNILYFLRVKTGDDFGNDPAEWIRRLNDENSHKVSRGSSEQ